MMKSLTSVFLAGVLLCSAVFVQAAPVDINSASAQEISAAMNGIGLKKAEAIVSYRDTNGAFKDIKELALVKGIGEQTIEKNRENIAVVAK